MRRSLLFSIGLLFLGVTIVELGLLAIRLRPPRLASTSNVPGDALLLAMPATSPAPTLDFIPGSTVQHQVAAGEWLLQIARCYGVSAQALAQANPQVSDPLQPLASGTVITVPDIGTVGRVYGTPCVVFYAVQSGDTWESIAERYAADIAVLRAVNPGNLSAGTLIKIPLNSGAHEGVCQRFSSPAGASPLTESGTAGGLTRAGSIDIPCYALGSSDGPTVNVRVTSGDRAARMAIVRTDGTVIKSGQDSDLSWTGSAPDLLGANIHIFSAVLNTVIHYTLEVTALPSTAATPTETAIPSTTVTPSAPAPQVRISVDWPAKLEVDQPGTIRISVITDNHSSPPITGNVTTEATARPVGTPNADLSQAFGPDYEVFVVPTLSSANMTRDPADVSPKRFNESPIVWEWSISWGSAGLKTINVSMEIQRQRRDGTAPLEGFELWRRHDPLQVNVSKPWLSIKDLSLTTPLTSLLGTLSFPFFYQIYKDWKQKAPSKPKPKPARKTK